MADKWIDVNVVPAPKNRHIDVWCVDPVGTTRGVRFTNVVMRGDGSGFGMIIHNREGVHWEYLEQEGEIFPLWKITHWIDVPDGPYDNDH